VKVRKQALHDAKLKSRQYVEVRMTRSGLDLSVPRHHEFQGARRRCSDRNHASLLSRCALKLLRRFPPNLIPFGIEYMGFGTLGAHGKKSSDSDMQSDGYDFDSLSPHRFKNCWRKVKPGSRGCDRARMSGKHSLITGVIERRSGPLNVGWKRDLPVTL
jgi:hypothetical protein